MTPQAPRLHGREDFTDEDFESLDHRPGHETKCLVCGSPIVHMSDGSLACGHGCTWIPDVHVNWFPDV